MVIRCGPGGESSGGCTAWGFSLKNEALAISLRGKNSGYSFRPVYGSGDSGPEDVLEFSASLRGDIFSAGAALYSEKDLTVSPGYDERRCFFREELFLAASVSPYWNCECRWAVKQSFDCDGGPDAHQFSAVMNFLPCGRLIMKARGAVKRSGSCISYLCSGEMKLMFLSYFSIGAGYLYVKGSSENEVYAVITPAAENTMDINRFVSRGYGFALKLKYSKERDSFHFRFSGISSEGSVDYNAESALALLF